MPILKQYTEIKKEYPDALIWFEHNGYITAIKESATLTSHILGTELTTNPITQVIETTFTNSVFESNLELAVKSGNRVALVEDIPLVGYRTSLSKIKGELNEVHT